MINPPDATHPNGTSEFHVGCGIRVRGGYSRSGDDPKHGWHLYFRSDYGDSKLNYPLFGRFGTTSFDQIDLRTAENYSWSFGGDPNNTFLREECSRLALTDLGDPGSHLRYVHCYVNGQYFGLYDFDERTEASFGASYLPGSKDDFDVVKDEQDQAATSPMSPTAISPPGRISGPSRAPIIPTRRMPPTSRCRVSLPMASPRPPTPCCSMSIISSTTCWTLSGPGTWTGRPPPSSATRRRTTGSARATATATWVSASSPTTPSTLSSARPKIAPVPSGLRPPAIGPTSRIPIRCSCTRISRRTSNTRCAGPTACKSTCSTAGSLTTAKVDRAFQQPRRPSSRARSWRSPPAGATRRWPRR